MSSSIIGGMVAVIVAVLVVGIASRKQKHPKDDASKKIQLKKSEGSSILTSNPKNKEKKTKKIMVGAGLALGVGIGIAIGNAIGNVGVGLAIGIALGIGVSAEIQSKKQFK